MDKDLLTERQRQAMFMRYTYRWTMQRIALKMGTSRQAVFDLLQHAHLRLGFPRLPRTTIRKVKPRRRKAVQLSLVPEETIGG
ncbi:MAG TPA: sigma factor-like helix-turn-helix DNA-binding protein [Humisphaera sp.]|nr:sigma factor-like helix-turn-helix DNA-binding protein [Humisphaera sp.]